MVGARTSRRELFAGAARGIGAAVGGGSLWAHLLTQESRAAPFALRPPGALAEDAFQVLCVKCGLCVADCPYDTLKLAAVGRSPAGSPAVFSPDRCRSSDSITAPAASTAPCSITFCSSRTLPGQS